MVAIPGMGVFIRENRTVTQANEILSSVNYARNETINRGVSVRVEPITAGTTWTGGWLLRIDGNNDGDYADGDTIDVPIRYFEALESATLTSSAATFIYESEGNLSGTTDITLTLTPEVCTTGEEYIRTLTIKPSGHARIAKSSCP